MAVPYSACGTPSPRSEFKHPDSNLCLTLLAYMQRGLSARQVRECLQALFAMEPSQQEKVYRCPPPKPPLASLVMLEYLCVRYYPSRR